MARSLCFICSGFVLVLSFGLLSKKKMAMSCLFTDGIFIIYSVYSAPQQIRSDQERLTVMLGQWYMCGGGGEGEG